MTRTPPTLVDIPDHIDTLALCGGPYSNFAAVDAFLAATAAVPYRFCLGDIGGFGPHPDRTIELIRASGMVCVQGNYDHAVGFDEHDCGCGYVDPLDRSTAQISFEYTARNTSLMHKSWLRSLPQQIILRWRGVRILLCHGSPDSVNEFVWESETDDRRIDQWLLTHDVAGIAATHSGLPWVRETARGFWCNVGVLGRPPHHGSPDVGYALLRFPLLDCRSGEPDVLRRNDAHHYDGRHSGEQIPRRDYPIAGLERLVYDPAPVATAIRAEGLPDAFAQSLENGEWTTCTAILPAREHTVGARYPTEETTSQSPGAPYASPQHSGNAPDSNSMQQPITLDHESLHACHVAPAETN